MKELIARLEEAFDIVIIDAPPLLPVTDAAVLSQHVGGVVVVVGAQKLKTQDLHKSLAALDMVDSNVLGVVLNRLPAKGPDAYAYSYYGTVASESKKSDLKEPNDGVPERDPHRVSAGSHQNFFDETLFNSPEATPRRYPADRIMRGNIDRTS